MLFTLGPTGCLGTLSIHRALAGDLMVGRLPRFKQRGVSAASSRVDSLALGNASAFYPGYARRLRSRRIGKDGPHLLVLGH